MKIIIILTQIFFLKFNVYSHQLVSGKKKLLHLSPIYRHSKKFQLAKLKERNNLKYIQKKRHSTREVQCSLCTQHKFRF